MTVIPDQPVGVDRTTRLLAAKKEDAVLKQWTANGAKGTAPATPNLDAISAEADYRPQGGTVKRKSKPTASSTPFDPTETEKMTRTIVKETDARTVTAVVAEMRARQFKIGRQGAIVVKAVLAEPATKPAGKNVTPRRGNSTIAAKPKTSRQVTPRPKKKVAKKTAA